MNPDDDKDETESESPEIEFGESYPDTLEGPDCAWHFGGDAQEFLMAWCALAGVEVKGSALALGENGSIAILLFPTGEVKTLREIAEGKRKGAVRQIK